MLLFFYIGINNLLLRRTGASIATFYQEIIGDLQISFILVYVSESLILGSLLNREESK